METNWVDASWIGGKIVFQNHASDIPTRTTTRNEAGMKESFVANVLFHQIRNAMDHNEMIMAPAEV